MVLSWLSHGTVMVESWWSHGAFIAELWQRLHDLVQGVLITLSSIAHCHVIRSFLGSQRPAWVRRTELRYFGDC